MAEKKMTVQEIEEHEKQEFFYGMMRDEFKRKFELVSKMELLDYVYGLQVRYRTVKDQLRFARQEFARLRPESGDLIMWMGSPVKGAKPCAFCGKVPMSYTSTRVAQNMWRTEISCRFECVKMEGLCDTTPQKALKNVLKLWNKREVDPNLV